MSLFVSSVVRATDANNAVLSGAKWYFYVTGGTTPAAIYTTSALNVAHANPVVADSAGLFAPIYLNPTTVYRATLKTSSGSIIQDIDPYNPSERGTFGFEAGDGGAITQTGSKSSTVILNKRCGQITMHAASLASGAVVVFTCTNSFMVGTNTVNINFNGSGAAAPGCYRCWIDSMAAGYFNVAVENRTGGALAEALVLNFAVVQGVNA